MSLPPSNLETASLVVLGHAPRRASGPSTCTPLIALENAIRPALHRPPCLVSFSGGMDSSFVLAVAAGLARRERLPAPVPITWRFTGAPAAEESTWQERVIADLRIEDWRLLQAEDDLDLIGPVAQRLLNRFGLLQPANAHLHLPIMEAATGGSVLTGVGGDQILAGWRRPGAPRRTVRRRLPGPLVARVQQRRGNGPFPWLRPAVARQLTSRLRREQYDEPRRIDQRMAWHARRRELLRSCSSLATIAAAENVQLVHPLLDPRFLVALQDDVRGTSGLARGDLLLRIADGTLPDAATARRPKAHFLEVFLREPTRQFVRFWDGTGVDETLVNAEALRGLWSRWPIPDGTAGLVQQLWLARSPASRREGVPA